MKAVVVLALCVFAVCDANILWEDAPPKNQLDLVKDAFWDYVAKVTLTAERSLKEIRQSELGQDVNVMIAQNTQAVNTYIAGLNAQADHLKQSFITEFTEQAEQLKVRLEKDLTAVSTYSEDVVAQLQSQVEQMKKDAAPYAEAMDPEALKAVLLKKSQELQAQIDKNMNEMQAQMVPYTEEMRKKTEQSLEEFKKSMIPLAENFQTQLTQKTQEIHQNLAPYGEDLKAKLDASTQDLQAQLAALWESFTKKTQ